MGYNYLICSMDQSEVIIPRKGWIEYFWLVFHALPWPRSGIHRKILSVTSTDLVGLSIEGNDRSHLSSISYQCHLWHIKFSQIPFQETPKIRRAHCIQGVVLATTRASGLFHSSRSLLHSKEHTTVSNTDKSLSNTDMHSFIYKVCFLALPHFKSTFLGQFLTYFKKLGRFKKVLIGAISW